MTEKLLRTSLTWTYLIVFARVVCASQSTQILPCSGKLVGDSCSFTWYTDPTVVVDGVCQTGHIDGSAQRETACKPGVVPPSGTPNTGGMSTSSAFFAADLLAPCAGKSKDSPCTVITSANAGNFSSASGTCKPGQFGEANLQGCLVSKTSEKQIFLERPEQGYCTVTCESLGFVSGGLPTPYTFQFSYQQYVKTGNPYNWRAIGSMIGPPRSSVTCTQHQTTLTVVSNGIPNHNSAVLGTLPRNLQNPQISLPVQPQSYNWSIPCRPELSSHRSTLPAQGVIGVARNGVPIYNRINAAGDDVTLQSSSNAWEPADLCFGVSSTTGAYHYNKLEAKHGCLFPPGKSQLIGVALDGFPIYSTDISMTDQLDACGGYLHPTLGYRYYVQTGFQTPACFSGTPIASMNSSTSRGSSWSTVHPVPSTCPLGRSAGIMTTVCSGHGSCNSLTFVCTCDQGYYGHACDLAQHQYDRAVKLTARRAEGQSSAHQYSIQTMSKCQYPNTVLCPNTTLVATSKHSTCVGSPRDCMMANVTNLTVLEELKVGCEKPQVAAPPKPSLPGNSTFCGTACALEGLRCSDVLPPLSPCGNKIRCITGECAATSESCRLQDPSKLCRSGIPCGNGLTCAPTEFLCAQRVAYMGCPMSMYQCDSMNSATGNIAWPSCTRQLSACNSTLPCPRGYMKCGSRRIRSHAPQILKNGVWQLEPLCLPESWNNCTISASPLYNTFHFTDSQLLKRVTLSAQINNIIFLNVSIPPNAFLNQQAGSGIFIELKPVPTSTLRQGAFQKHIKHNTVMSPIATVTPKTLLTVRSPMHFQLSIDPHMFISTSSNATNDQNVSNQIQTSQTLPNCSTLLSSLSVYYAADVMDGTEAVKLANCMRGSGACSCVFSVTQFGTFALIDDCSMLLPPAPPASQLFFAFEAITSGSIPQWIWLPSSPDSGPDTTARSSAWSKIPSELKALVFIVAIAGVIFYGTYRLWRWRFVDMPRDPVTGNAMGLGTGTREPSLFSKLKARYHAWRHPEEVAKNAQAELKRRHELQELRQKMRIALEQKKLLKDRARPLERAGPEPFNHNDFFSKKDFLIEMYKPLDKDRVYAKAGETKAPV